MTSKLKIRIPQITGIVPKNKSKKILSMTDFVSFT